VVTARAKGLPPFKALVRYPLRVALNPFIADIGGLLPEIISGAAIVSVVLSLPTTGPMLLDALRSQDMYLAGSFLMFLAALTVIGVLVSDLLLAVLDPRIRLGGGAVK
ncbi:MAG: ABC transporter permease subunit, partial [Alphaproteobacteria bacterium]